MVRIKQMDENPYRSPDYEPARQSRFLRAWSSPAVCMTAIIVPTLIPLASMLLNFFRDQSQQTTWMTSVSLALGVWTFVVLALNERARRSKE